MSFPKFLGILTLVLFGLIGIAVVLKVPDPQLTPLQIASEVIHSSFDPDALDDTISAEDHSAHLNHMHKESFTSLEHLQRSSSPSFIPNSQAHDQLPSADLIEALFNKRYPRLPIVKTITYKNQVEWLKGKPAWLWDYATHYRTSRHFIARSLNNGRLLYDQQNVVNGDQFNVFNEEVDLEFYLVVDASLCRLWLYYYDRGKDERVLLKTYSVGLGRLDKDSPSGTLTPFGTFSLGNRIATYGPNTLGSYRGQHIKMSHVFGTRWIPFDQELGSTTHPAKGFGLHGAPWQVDAAGNLKENRESIGHYESDGCIRLVKEDIEEIYAIIVTRPSRIEIVPQFKLAHLPGKAVEPTAKFFH